MRVAGLVLLTSLMLSSQEKEDYKDVVLPASAEDLARGKLLYDGSCQLCHGPRGDGGKATNLAQAKLPRAATDGDLVRLITTGLPGTEMPGAWHMVRNEVAQVAAYVRTFARIAPEKVPGDPSKGRAIYHGKGGCPACHTLKTADGRWEGGLMGPDLTQIGSRRSAAHLRRSLVKPEAETPDSYVYSTVTLKNGKKVEGKRVNEETFLIILRDSTGANHVIQKADTTHISHQRNKTPMPSYQDKLASAELEDLIAYLHSLQEVK